MALNVQPAQQTNTMINNIRSANIAQEAKLSISMENAHALNLFSGLDIAVFNAIILNILTLHLKDA